VSCRHAGVENMKASEALGGDIRTRRNLLFVGFSLSLLWIIAWWMTPNHFEIIASHGHFFGLGLVGAIVANSTGSGGGVVFIPSFTSLGVTPMEALGTSIAIQCFGMTAGSISWVRAFRAEHQSVNSHLNQLKRILVLVVPWSIMGMLIGQFLLPMDPGIITPLFRTFSVVFGGILLYMTLFRQNKPHTHQNIRPDDRLLIMATGLFGGLITSWISVGVGELLALTMIFRGYPTMVAVASAVCVSSLTVLSGIWHHLLVTNSVVWEVFLFAVPAAVFGGSVARLLAKHLGAARLKIFFATWILVTGLMFG